MKKSFIKMAMVLAAISGVSMAHAQAQEVGAATAANPTILDKMGVNLKAGTAGGGVDFVIPVRDNINMRLGYSTYSYNKSVTEEGITYDGNLKLGGYSVLGDWYPSSNSGWRLTGGIYSPKHEIGGKAQYSGTGTIEVNGVSYTSEQLGNLEMSAKWNKVKPYLGIGYDTFQSAKGGMYFTADVGVILSGSPKVSLTGNCGAAVSPEVCGEINSNLRTEEASLNNELKKLKALPVVQIGVGYRF